MNFVPSEPFLPEKYNAMRRALAEASRVDEVKAIRDKSVALKVYAFQTKDAELGAWMTEIVRRARRRIGALMAEKRDAGELPKGGRPLKTGVKKTPVLPDLEDLGIDKNLAKEARKDWAMPEATFEESVAKDKALVRSAITDGGKGVIKAAKAKAHKEKRAQREQREKELSKKLAALPEKKYAVILADPEWKFEVWSEKGLTNSSADNHYPTSALDVIKARNVPSISADDAVLFLWATVPMLPEALEVMSAWGFTYKTNFVWVKDRHGTGYWNRNRHEHLLVGTRGKIPAPAPGDQMDSVIEAPKGRHSEKPDPSLVLIEKMFPTLPKIELNQRLARDGWDGWGLEANE